MHHFKYKLKPFKILCQIVKMCFCHVNIAFQLKTWYCLGPQDVCDAPGLQSEGALAVNFQLHLKFFCFNWYFKSYPFLQGFHLSASLWKNWHCSCVYLTLFALHFQCFWLSLQFHLQSALVKLLWVSSMFFLMCLPGKRWWTKEDTRAVNWSGSNCGC